MKVSRPPHRITPGFAFSLVERALNECLGRREFGLEEMAQVSGFFAGREQAECVYCGNLDPTRFDHLVAVRNGGETVLGNMVPSCAHCDDSKRDLPFAKWMTSSAKLSPNSLGVPDIERRIERIKSYVLHFSYNVHPLEDRLNDNELEKLRTITCTLKDVRCEIDSLIQEYKARPTRSKSGVWLRTMKL